MKDIFTSHYQNNHWKNDESVSGHGSTLDATTTIRDALPTLVSDLKVKTLLDIPCGDFNWFSSILFDDDAQPYYIGADIVRELVYQNERQYPGTDFRVLDVTKDKLPQVDLILCRDLLGHLSNVDVKRALRNIRRSNTKYLLATTFPDHENSGDIRTGDWRAINLAQYFGLPDPLLLINEGCTAGSGAFADKSLGLWRIGEEDGSNR